MKKGGDLYIWKCSKMLIVFKLLRYKAKTQDLYGYTLYDNRPHCGSPHEVFVNINDPNLHKCDQKILDKVMVENL